MQTAASHCDPGSWNYMCAISFIILSLDAGDYFAVSFPHWINNIHPTTKVVVIQDDILETTTTASTTTAIERRKHG